MNWALVDTPVAPLALYASDAGLRAVLFSEEPAPVDAVRAPHPVLVETERQLGEYFAGERLAFELPLDVVGTAFQRRAWLGLALSPFGTTISWNRVVPSDS